MRRTPERNLPEPFASWIDRAAPLPSGVTLLPRTVFPLGDALMPLLLGASSITMIVMFIALPPWKWDPEVEGWTPYLVMGTVCLALWAIPLFLLRRASVTFFALLDQRRGQLRQGIFLGPEGLLARLEPGKCYVVTWDQFAQARIFPPLASRDTRKKVFIIETHDDKLEFFAEWINAVPKQIHNFLQKLEPNWSPPESVERADRAQRKDELTGKKLTVAALRFGAAMLLLLGITAAIIIAGEKSPWHDWLAFAWLIAFLFLFGAVVNVFYRFGRVSWRYRCPECGARKLGQVDEALPEIHYYCRFCNVEWDTGWEVKESSD